MLNVQPDRFQSKARYPYDAEHPDDEYDEQRRAADVATWAARAEHPDGADHVVLTGAAARAAVEAHDAYLAEI
jgi:hypothetical protein